jgi:hypothetical protein
MTSAVFPEGPAAETEGWPCDERFSCRWRSLAYPAPRRPGARPAKIDLVPARGPGKAEAVLAIYRLEGKRLTLCWPLGDDQRRPKAFGEKGSERLP